MESRKRVIKNHYEPLLDRYTSGYEILDWESGEAQLKRFETLAGNVDLAGKKLLDIGCGTGDLYGYLKGKHIPVLYYGVDILERMTERASLLHPDGKFFSGDVFTQNMFAKKQFDVVFASGLFSLNLGNNETFLVQSLPVLFKYSKRYVVFNLLSQAARNYGNTYYFFDEKDVVHHVRKYSAHVSSVSGYVPGDFTIIAEVSVE